MVRGTFVTELIMEIGYKFNPRGPVKPPEADWLTLPIFRFFRSRQRSGVSQDLVSKVKYLYAQGYKLHGHPLVDKRDAPRVDRVEDLRTYLVSMTDQYRELISSWDVCNECSGWDMRRWGSDWQLKVFAMARDLFPNAQLWLNEYAVNSEPHWENVTCLTEKLSKEGLIDGVGIQCRADITEKVPGVVDWGFSKLFEPLPAPKLENAIADIHGLGLVVHLSEVECLHSPGQESSAAAIIKRYERVGREQGAQRLTYWQLLK